MLVLSLFCDNPDLNSRATTRVNHLGLMGLYPAEKAASTGTLTMIVVNTMEWNKACKKFFVTILIFISIYFNHIVFNVCSNV